jgi:TolB-like protein
MGFVSELKRRNVFRVGVAYALVAWLLMQIGQTLFPAFSVPDSIFRGMVIVLLLGFPVALLASWIYDITPDGIKRDSEVDRSVSITGQPSRKLDFAIIGLLAMAVVYLALDKFVLQGSDPEPVAANAIPEEPPLGERPSIAVLPFQNRSALKEDAYFVDGIHDDTLTQLAKISALTVIARTSVEQYRDTRIPVRQIARELGVAVILEGGVQRAGDRVRINIQLIDASNEAHLWAETYDRQHTAPNIFAIQT